MLDARLEVTDSLGRRVVPIDRPVFIIGRHSGADLQIVSTEVSRNHAEIVHDAGQYVVRDRKSRYGTFVNGETVAERALVNGDRIRLGPSEAVELLFLIETPPLASTRDPTFWVADLRQIAGLLDGLRALGSGRVLEEVLTLVIDGALDVTTADRGFVMLANSRGELEFKIARGKGQLTLSGTSFATSWKIPREVFRTGHSLIISDLTVGNLAEVHEDTVALGIRHVLCVPLRVVRHLGGPRADVEDRLIGVLYLDGQEKSTLRTEATGRSLEAFATEAALAIESARLYAESAEKARIDRDLRSAAEIQRALLPEPRHAGAGFDLAAVTVPCHTIGGDFFDYLDLADGHFGFALGDVAGKGPSAALLTAVVQTVFAAQATTAGEPAETMMARINCALLRRAVEARFATMFYGVLSPDGSVRFCNAGHDPPVVVRRTGPSPPLETGGVVLGLFPTATYEADTVHLAPGDVIVVCSDGISEARSASDEEFGRERWVKAVAGSHDLEPEAVLERLLAAIGDFTAGAVQSDDLTALVLRYRGGA